MEDRDKLLKWERFCGRLRVGDRVTGRVFKHEPYGVYVDIGEDFYGIVLVPMIRKEPRIRVEEYPAIGSSVTAVILAFSPNREMEYSYVSLSMKDIDG
ncbi:hypothetical protein FUAX_55260 (plasmid) [Fulvitalea axinellae]|uniref:S1 motif domain-containing protein n=1 Tax=Fulvitalea axinellae TaxID=1182444 RepID=A0AAU9CME6_9BACT|nr:hypothetical protein FUAX_55260 [Fulvitalea axinellae]